MPVWDDAAEVAVNHFTECSALRFRGFVGSPVKYVAFSLLDPFGRKREGLEMLDLGLVPLEPDYRLISDFTVLRFLRNYRSQTSN